MFSDVVFSFRSSRWRYFCFLFLSHHLIQYNSVSQFIYVVVWKCKSYMLKQGVTQEKKKKIESNDSYGWTRCKQHSNIIVCWTIIQFWCLVGFFFSFGMKKKCWRKNFYFHSIWHGLLTHLLHWEKKQTNGNKKFWSNSTILTSGKKPYSM